jgi:heat-inducible transcriptional repressor
MAGVVSIPTIGRSTLKHIEFLSLSENRVLAILVFSAKDIQNRIIHTERAYKTAELQRIANYLNAELIGADINTVREKILREMREAKADADSIMLTAIEMANTLFQQDRLKPDYVIAGETNLMHYGEMADINLLRQLFEAFNEKRGILQLLDHALHAPGVQIFIGSESGFDALNDCSVVTATYSSDDNVIGSLAVIGPTRMAYDQVIPIVDITAKILGSALNQR